MNQKGENRKERVIVLSNLKEDKVVDTKIIDLTILERQIHSVETKKVTDIYGRTTTTTNDITALGNQAHIFNNVLMFTKIHYPML